MAKYVDAAKARIQEKVKFFRSVVSQASARSLNEADTRDIVKAVLGDVLGYDPFFEVTGEFAVKGQYADFAVKFEDQVQFFVEVKSIGTKLDSKHIFQVIGYAANHGVEWAVLTNSDQWIVYRLFVGDTKQAEPLVDFSFSSLKDSDLISLFYLFSKEGFRQRALESHWKDSLATKPKSVARSLLTDAVLNELRKEIYRSSKLTVTIDQLRSVLVNEVFRGDLSDLVKEQ